MAKRKQGNSGNRPQTTKRYSKHKNLSSQMPQNQTTKEESKNIETIEDTAEITEITETVQVDTTEENTEKECTVSDTDYVEIPEVKRYDLIPAPSCVLQPTKAEQTEQHDKQLPTTQTHKHFLTLHLSHKGGQKTFRFKPLHVAAAGVAVAVALGYGVHTTVSYHQAQKQLAESQSQLEQEKQQNQTLNERTEQLENENEQYMQNIEQIQQKATDLENKMTELDAQKQELTDQLNTLAASDTASADTCLSILENGTQTEKSFTTIVTTAYNKPEALSAQLDKMDILLDQTSAEFISVASDLTYTLGQQTSTPAGWPTQGYVSTEFNPDGDPSVSDGRTHKGVDIATNHQMIPITATASGTVVESGFSSGGYGYCVKIDHGNGFTTLYAHNSENLVEVGDTVTKGQVIAISGSTGMSTGIHCHYEIQLNGVYQDPRDYM